MQVHKLPYGRAGFDAHKKDEINFRYIGVTERDYEWLTEQLVAVANRRAHQRCCADLCCS
jgi:acetoin utilization deacetylase AcuC-like enzyme